MLEDFRSNLSRIIRKKLGWKLEVLQQWIECALNEWRRRDANIVLNKYWWQTINFYALHLSSWKRVWRLRTFLPNFRTPRQRCSSSEIIGASCKPGYFGNSLVLRMHFGRVTHSFHTITFLIVNRKPKLIGAMKTILESRDYSIVPLTSI